MTDAPDTVEALRIKASARAVNPMRTVEWQAANELVALRAENERLKAPAAWPPCMAPDGAEPCLEYQQVVAELTALRAELEDTKSKLETAGYDEDYVFGVERERDALRAEVERLKARMRESNICLCTFTQKTVGDGCYVCQEAGDD